MRTKRCVDATFHTQCQLIIHGIRNPLSVLIVSKFIFQGSAKCSNICCAEGSSEPFQPRSKIILEKTSQTSGVGKNFRVRTFQVDWYNNYPWITLCATSNLVFCYYCRKIKQKGLSTLSSKQEKAFTVDGFGNWKKALQRFKEHESSQGHKESMEKHILMRQPSVASQLTTQLKTSQALHRRLLEKEISSIKYLLRQGMPLRGK